MLLIVKNVYSCLIYFQRLGSQTSPCTFSALRDISQQLLVDPSDLQIKDTLGHGYFCVIKTASLHHKQTESAVMVKILSKGEI